MSDTFDLLLTGGTVLNPASRLRQELDVGITAGRIAAMQPKLAQDNNAKKILDCSGGCYVTPGLIDFHVHSYWGVNPYGFNADSICLASGVTTAMDAGSSGPVNFLGFKLVHESSKTRMLAFVAIAEHGVLNDPGELQNLRFADPEAAASSVAESPNVGVGIKVRLHKKGVGDNGRQALRLAIQAGDACRSPVMVHVGDTGDIYGRDRRHPSSRGRGYPLLHAAKAFHSRSVGPPPGCGSQSPGARRHFRRGSRQRPLRFQSRPPRHG